MRGLLSTAPIALILAGDEIPLSAKGWAAVALLSVLTGMLAHGLLAASQREVDVATIGILQVAQPALAVVWSYILLGEEIRPAQVPGMVLVIVGLAAFSLVSYRRPANRPVESRPNNTGSSRDQWAERVAAAADREPEPGNAGGGIG